VLPHLLHHLLHAELVYGAGDAVGGVVEGLGEDLGLPLPLISLTCRTDSYQRHRNREIRNSLFVGECFDGVYAGARRAGIVAPKEAPIRARPMEPKTQRGSEEWRVRGWFV